MSAVRRNLKNKSLKEKCEIICHIEKGVANKEASEMYGVPKNTISTWMKSKDKFFSVLLHCYIASETSLPSKKLHSCNYKEVGKAVCGWFILLRSQ